MSESALLQSIVPTPQEDAQQRLLKSFARTASEVLTNENIPHALKGGTALQIGYGLPRPSTDADFEGDTRVNPKVLTRRAFKAQTEYELRGLGVNWLRRSSIKIYAQERTTGQNIQFELDYRVSGTMPGMDPSLPMDRTIVRHGIRMFDLPTIADRKLNALIGEKPREQPRDVFDAAYLAQRYPNALTDLHWQKLRAWFGSLTDRKRRTWRKRFENDDVMSRSNFDHVLEVLDQELSNQTVFGATRDRNGDSGPSRRQLVLVEDAEVPETGPVAGDIAARFTQHPDPHPAMLMGEAEAVVFGLSTADGQVTPLYTIRPGEEAAFETWMHQHEHLWGTPFGSADSSGSGVSNTVKQFREESLAAEKGIDWFP